MRLKKIRFYSGLGSLFSFFLSIIFGMFATKPFVVFCAGDMCDEYDPKWRDIFVEGTPRYYLAGIGEVLSYVFFYLAVVSFVVFIITWVIKWIRR